MVIVDIFAMRRLQTTILNAIVIGAGPAGIAASLQLKRAGLNPVLIEKNKIGGSALNANLIENYPGFPHGIKGIDLADLFKKQVDLNNIDIIISKAKKISWGKDYFKVKLDNQELISRAVIVATGATPKKLGVVGEKELSRNKLFYEIKKIPLFVRERDLTIIGSGDAAFDYALNLAERKNKIKILCRQPTCLRILKERVNYDKNIKIITNSNVIELKKEKDRVKTIYEKKGAKSSILSDYLLIAVGRESNVKIFAKKYKDVNSMIKERAPNLFFAGDVKRGLFRQVGIAVGDGLYAAMKAIKYLEEKNA